MIYNNNYIKENYAKLNNMTEDNVWKYIKIFSRLICNIEYPTIEQIEYALQYDNEEGYILKNIKHFPEEFLVKVKHANKYLLKYMKNVPIKYLIKLGLIPGVNSIGDIPPSGVNQCIFQDWINEYNKYFYLEDLPKNLLTKENIKYCIKTSKYAQFNGLPAELYDEEIVDILMNKDSDNLKYIPESLLTYEHYKKFLINTNTLIPSGIQSRVNIPNDIANKLVIDSDITPIKWDYLDNASEDAYAQRLVDISDVNVLEYVPNKILTNLFKHGKLNWILNGDYSISNLDLNHVTNQRERKSKLLNNTTEEYQLEAYKRGDSFLSKFSNISPSIIKMAIDDNRLNDVPFLAEDKHKNLIDYALEKDNLNIIYVKNPSHELKKKAILMEPRVLLRLNTQQKIEIYLTDSEICDILIEGYENGINFIFNELYILLDEYELTQEQINKANIIEQNQLKNIVHKFVNK